VPPLKEVLELLLQEVEGLVRQPEKGQPHLRACVRACVSARPGLSRWPPVSSGGPRSPPVAPGLPRPRAPPGRLRSPWCLVASQTHTRCRTLL
jgi:hypothetical protein